MRSSALFPVLSFVVICCQGQGAVVYTFGDPEGAPVSPIVLDGNSGTAEPNTQAFDLDGDGRDELNFFVNSGFGGALTFEVSNSGLAGLKVAESPAAASGLGTVFYGGPVPAAQKVETALGVTSELNYDDFRGVLASNSFFATESDGQWSNGGGGSVTGFVAMTFEKGTELVTLTYLGFLEVRVTEATQTAEILSYGYNDTALESVPEPGSAMLALIGAVALVNRRR
ncbi:MAG: PEP-CTERM sorting domain-containing protein [Verrucomicrobiaceae bacterium]